MRILFLGEISHGQTSLMRMRALVRLGHTVDGVDTIEPWRRASWVARQVQRRLQWGEIINRINKNVLKAARVFKPDLIWAEKQEYLWPETIDRLRAGGAFMAHFTPDPYFSLSWKRTRVMDAAMDAFDVLVYCKSYERLDYAALGKPTIYMPLGFCDEVHRPMGSVDSFWQCAVGFLGGWEPRREEMLTSVVKVEPDLKIWGGLWEFFRDGQWSPRRHLLLSQQAGKVPFKLRRNALLESAFQGNEVYGEDYARALTGARIGLGFLRRVCPDQHTTRTFEIPACASMLLGDRTDEHCELFEEGKQAEFFSSDEELADKVRYYSSNSTARDRIAAAGYERAHRGQYAYVHRLRAVLRQLDALRG
jgi:spore maturation protein CgeB